jgi:hypothetical protein
MGKFLAALIIVVVLVVIVLGACYWSSARRPAPRASVRPASSHGGLGSDLPLAALRQPA